MKLLILIFLLITSQSVLAKDGFVLFSKGQFQINSSIGKTKDPIKYGDLIKTSKNSFVVLDINPSMKLKIKPNTVIQIERPKVENKKSLYSVLLKKGEIFFKANKKNNNRFQVSTKKAVMGVRGTHFFVTNYNEKVWMCVNEGTVAVEMNNKEVLVKEGQGVLINSAKLPEVKKYEWTQGLNWKMQGSLNDIEDKTDIKNLNYDVLRFQYE